MPKKKTKITHNPSEALAKEDMSKKHMERLRQKEVRKTREYPRYSEAILPQLQPTLERFATGPLKEYAPGVEKALTLFLDRFLPVPRPTSKKGSLEGAMTRELGDIAAERNWQAEIDGADNIGMVVPATKGYEHVGVIMVQAHKDIVPAQGPHALSDPADGYIEPQVVEIDGKQWLRAKDDTSFGADDGTGFVSLLQAAADLEQSDQPHGPILILGTSREESGLLGAKEMSFDPEGVVGKLLPEVKYILNSDGEERGKITVGSIGGEMMNITRPVTYEPLPEGMETIELRVSNLRGGHSGAYADHPGGVSILGEWLAEDNTPLQFASISTTNKFDNAIPQDATAVIALPAVMKDEYIAAMNKRAAQLQAAYTEDPIVFTVHETPKPDRVMDNASSAAAKTLLTQLGTLHGVDGTTEAFGTQLLDRSMNIGVVEVVHDDAMDADVLQFVTFSRISKPELFGTYPETIEQIAGKTGATVEMEGTVPIWKPNLESSLPYEMQALYEEIFGERAELEIAPGGLEVAVFDERWPSVEKGANGTTIVNAHAAGERVEVGSIAECYIFDLNLLKLWSKKLTAQATAQSGRRSQAA